MEFGTRVAAYVLLLTDEYPTFERNPKVAVLFPDVEGGKKLNRWLPLVKWILAIPLYIVGVIYLLSESCRKLGNQDCAQFEFDLLVLCEHSKASFDRLKVRQIQLKLAVLAQLVWLQ